MHKSKSLVSVSPYIMHTVFTYSAIFFLFPVSNDVCVCVLRSICILLVDIFTLDRAQYSPICHSSLGPVNSIVSQWLLQQMRWINQSLLKGFWSSWQHFDRTVGQSRIKAKKNKPKCSRFSSRPKRSNAMLCYSGDHCCNTWSFASNAHQ